jgi:hypothetical protein
MQRLGGSAFDLKRELSPAPEESQRFAKLGSRQKLRPPSRVALSSLLRIILPTLDNLRNFLLMPTAEMVSFLQQVREAP